MFQPLDCLLPRSMCQAFFCYELPTTKHIRILKGLLQCCSVAEVLRYICCCLFPSCPRKCSGPAFCTVSKLLVMPIPIAVVSIHIAISIRCISALRLFTLCHRSRRQHRSRSIVIHQCRYKRRCACTRSCGTASYYQLRVLIVCITKPGSKATSCLHRIGTTGKWDPSSPRTTVPVICAKSIIPLISRACCLWGPPSENACLCLN